MKDFKFVIFNKEYIISLFSHWYIIDVIDGEWCFSFTPFYISIKNSGGCIIILNFGINLFWY